MPDEQNEPGDEGAEKVEPAKNAPKRDYSQRAHHVVREVEKRPAERREGDE